MLLRALMRTGLAAALLAACVALYSAGVQALAQPVTPPIPPQAPIFNPSTPYTVPNPREVPVSPGSRGSISNFPNTGAGLGAELPPAKSPCDLFSGRPCHPSFCSVFHLGPCFPQYLPPIGQELRLTIVSTDDDEADESGADETKGGDDADQAAEEKSLDSIGELYAALSACWTPPAKDAARRGMEYTILFAFNRDGGIMAPPRRTYSSHAASPDVRDAYRDAVDAALKRCTPLHFSPGMAGAVAGRPVALRFVDERSLAKSIGKANSGQ